MYHYIIIRNPIKPSTAISLKPETSQKHPETLKPPDTVTSEALNFAMPLQSSPRGPQAEIRQVATRRWHFHQIGLEAKTEEPLSG